MAVKRGLGKGLEALFGEESIDRPKEDAKGGSVVYLNVNDIDRFENQPRKHFDEEKLSELADSIKAHGIVSPIIVNNNGGRYTIIAGERRYRAARLAGLAEVPAIVKDITDREHMELSLIENLQREDLNAMEEARAIALLMDEYSLTQEEVSNAISKSRSAVANTLRLLTLPSQVQGMVSSGAISAGHARCLVTLPDDEEKLRLALLISQKGLSVRETERLTSQGALSKRPKQEAKRERDRDVAEVERKLSERLETKVTLQGSFKRGKLVIEYYSYEQLESLYELMAGE